VNLRDFGQPWIPTGERSGLQTLMATENVLFSAPMKFLELQRAIHEFAVSLVL